MRYISLRDHVPDDQVWISKANLILQQLQSAPDDETRKQIIDANSQVWGELKQWLLSLSYNKCWFSEAKDCFNHWEVEHFRPKKSAKDIDGTEHMGYWWLAFDWSNFRICGNVGNRKKSTFFPLKEGCQRVGPAGDIRLEDPLLLDPADPDDPSLISFDFNGNAILSSGASDDWEKDRVLYSIERYNLNSYSLLVDQRKLIWSECWTLIQQYLSELNEYYANRSPIARQQFKEKSQQIRFMLQGDKEFSSIARACIVNSGDPRILDILRSQ